MSPSRGLAEFCDWVKENYIVDGNLRDKETPIQVPEGRSA